MSTRILARYGWRATCPSRQHGTRCDLRRGTGHFSTATLLDKAGLRHLVDDSASQDDAERSKPDPDIVQAALDRLDLPPELVVMAGDTPYDVEAAARAGVRTVALRTGGCWTDADFAGAAAIYDDPADLLAHLDDSPIES